MKVAIVLILTLCVMGLHAMPGHHGNMGGMRALAKLAKIAQEKKTAHKLENVLKAYKTTAKKLKQTKSEPSDCYYIDPVPYEGDYVPWDDEEIQRCGPEGYATAYKAALELLLENTEFDPKQCPDPEDGIWMEVLEDPFSLCDMKPAKLLLGFECVKHYFISHPIAWLYKMFVEPIGELIPPYFDEDATVPEY